MNNGGPAFPQHFVLLADGSYRECDSDDAGMSLRDYFAAAAVAGLCSVRHLSPAASAGIEKASAHFLAKHAYQIADAMLRERELPEPAA